MQDDIHDPNTKMIPFQMIKLLRILKLVQLIILLQWTRDKIMSVEKLENQESLFHRLNELVFILIFV